MVLIKKSVSEFSRSQLAPLCCIDKFEVLRVSSQDEDQLILAFQLTQQSVLSSNETEENCIVSSYIVFTTRTVLRSVCYILQMTQAKAQRWSESTSSRDLLPIQILDLDTGYWSED